MTNKDKASKIDVINCLEIIFLACLNPSSFQIVDNVTIQEVRVEARKTNINN